MNKTPITVMVSDEFHAYLQNIQAELKKQTNKKVSLSQIMLDLALKTANAQNKEKSTQDKTQNTQDFNINTQNFNDFAQNYQQNNEYSGNFYSQRELNILSEELKEREINLREFEKELYAENDKLFEKQVDILRLKEEALQKLNETETLKFQIATLKIEVNNLNAQNEMLTNDKQVLFNKLSLKLDRF